MKSLWHPGHSGQACVQKSCYIKYRRRQPQGICALFKSKVNTCSNLFCLFSRFKEIRQSSVFLKPLGFHHFTLFPKQNKKTQRRFSCIGFNTSIPYSIMPSLSERRELACFPPRDCSNRSPPLAWFRAFVQLFSLDSIVDKS